MPALFAEEEKESILSQIGQEALKQGMGLAKESVWQYFVNKSANNLHIVLGMSPVGDTLRTWCRNFPGTPELSSHVRVPLQQGVHFGEQHSTCGATSKVKHDRSLVEIWTLQCRLCPPHTIATGSHVVHGWMLSF